MDRDKLEPHPEFQAMLDKAFEESLRKHNVELSPKRSTRMIEGVAVGVIASVVFAVVGWVATQSYGWNHKPQVSANDTMEVAKNYEEKADD